MTIFAKQLKQLRQEKAFSQEGLAQELLSHVKLFQNGKRVKQHQIWKI